MADGRHVVTGQPASHSTLILVDSQHAKLPRYETGKTQIQVKSSTWELGNPGGSIQSRLNSRLAHPWPLALVLLYTNNKPKTVVCVCLRVLGVENTTVDDPGVTPWHAMATTYDMRNVPAFTPDVDTCLPHLEAVWDGVVIRALATAPYHTAWQRAHAPLPWTTPQ